MMYRNIGKCYIEISKCYIEKSKSGSGRAKMLYRKTIKITLRPR